MNTTKLQRLSAQVKEQVAEILHEMKDPRVTWASVVQADVSSDLSVAKIAVSVLDDEVADDVIRTLTKAAGHVRTELGKRMRIRQVPEIAFVRDRSIEYSSRVAQLIEEIHRNDKPRA